MTKRLFYIHHGYVQIAEIDATDETTPYVTKTYRWDPSEPVATRPLALTLWTREGTASETLYYAHDLRKNVVSLFDAKGMRRASYQYDPYGNITSMDGDMARENPYRYSPEHHDEDLGLVYYNYRHYNPTDGRWTSRDPIAEQGGWNLYGFVANHPLFSYDEKGLKENTNDTHILTVVASIQWWHDNKGPGGKEGTLRIGQWDTWIASPSISLGAYCCNGILKFPKSGDFFQKKKDGYTYTMAAKPQHNDTDESSGKIDFVSTIDNENPGFWEETVKAAVSAAIGYSAGLAVASTGVGILGAPHTTAAVTAAASAIISLYMGGSSEDQTMWGVSYYLSCPKVQGNPTVEQLSKPSGYWGTVGPDGISNRATMVGRGAKIGYDEYVPKSWLYTK